jgi:hypothetical protein
MENKKFAWWPTRVTSGQLVWFKFYYQHLQNYDPSTGKPPIHGGCFSWTETADERLWRLLKG